MPSQNPQRSAGAPPMIVLMRSRLVMRIRMAVLTNLVNS